MISLYLFTCLSSLLFIAYGVLIGWYWRAWKEIPFFKGTVAGNARITVLIPARNEESNIGLCLHSLVEQSYPKELFEVIVIDDHSTDRTAAIVEAFGAQLSIRCIRLAEQENPEHRTAHKKWAIETGISAASGELIVATDADCVVHPGWLSTIASFYREKGAKFIAAPVRISGGYDGRSGGRNNFLSIFQTLDFITLQGITGAAVFRKFHSMCNGANLAYEKKAFEEVGGFKGIDSIPSGDDMLLMHKIYLKYPDRVFFLKHRHAIVSTQPETRWAGFFNQRIRWASKADSYDDKRIFWVLLLVYIVNFLFLALLVGACRNLWWLWILLLLLLVKTAIEYPFVRSVAGFFEQQRLMVYFAPLQPFHILYTIVVGWLGKFGSYRWKDRKISK